LILAEIETGRELARFADPEQARLDGVAVTPDGSRVVTTLRDRPYLRVWDLRAIRRRLAGLDLDWYPPATFDAREAPGPFPPVPRPCRVDLGHLDSWLKQATETSEQTVARLTRAIEADARDVRLYHDRAYVWVGLQRFDEALADFTAALRLRPGDVHLRACRGEVAERLSRLDEALADCEAALRQEPDPDDREQLARLCNNLARTLAARPDPRRDPARALDLARQAVKLAAEEASYLNTLGVAEYRAGRYAEAVATLEKSLAAGKGEADAFDLLFLAMARHRLGRVAEARVDFDRALKWRRDHPNPSARWTAELDTFQAEARALLDGPPAELPADVFATGPPSRP
jgi:tetratricopeptide (TPR) repeat protein